MGGLLLAEWRKTTSTKLWWGLLIPICLLSALINVFGGALAISGAFGSGGLADQAVELAMATALSLGGILVVVFGIVSVSGEFRNRTITTTYLTGGTRTSVLVAKAVFAAAVGAAYAVAIELVGIGAALLGQGSASLGDPGRLAVLCVLGVVVLATWAVFGVLFGALVSNLLAAVISALTYLLIVENVLQAVLTSSRAAVAGYFLPGEAPGAALISYALGGRSSGVYDDIPPWPAALLAFAVYTVVLGAIGWAISQRRDVT